MPDQSHRPDKAARLSEIEEVVTQALNQIPSKYREMVLLRDLQGLDYEAIARITRVRKGTVKSRLARAREQLRSRILELAGEEL